MQRAGILALLLLSSIIPLYAQGVSRAVGAAPRLAHNFAPHAGGGHITSLPDTVRVLAVMVDFKEDSDNRTSGTGKFGTIYEYDYGTEILDPMPHDRAFFQHHMQFLENYVRKVSGRRTIVAGEVLDGIVTVSGSISDYSFRKNESEAPVAKLAVEAWEKAVQQFTTVEFSKYHMFVVFHAGRGRDIDLTSIQGFDPTPFDIPSLSFTPSAFKRLLGDDFNGVAAGVDFRITNCAVLPTTDNREISNIDGSRSLLELTINGLLAASFGTWAGLPDLFDTKTGKTGIGRFGLMDGEGIFAYGGICPPAPSAWEKQQLGWTSPRTASSGSRNYLITAGDSLSTADVIRVPINNIEYWLVENRQRDMGGNGQLITLVSGGQVQQLRFPKDTLGFDNGNVSQLKGVVIDVEDIDWGLPGGRVLVDDNEARINGGLLIWHIDEAAIEARLESNTVNVTANGRVLRGVDLEQAGGPQDIGVDVQTVFGTQTGTGSAIDYWTKDNISPVYRNSFGERTSPNTRANSGAFTHVTMQNFSVSGPIMTLDIAVGDNVIAPVEGFPVDLRASMLPGQTARFIQSADLDADGADEFIVLADGSATEDVSLQVLRGDGTPYLPGGYRSAELSSIVTATGPPAIGDITGDGVPEIAVVGRNASGHSVYVLSANDANADGSLDIVQRQFFPTVNGKYSLLTGTPRILHGALVLVVRSPSVDSLIVLRSGIESFPADEQTELGWDVPKYVLPLDEAGMVYIHGLVSGIAMSLTGVQQPINITSYVKAGIEPSMRTVSAMADMTGDGRREIIMRPGSSEIWVASYTLGGPSEPADVLRAEALSLDSISSLAFADVDGDGRSDLLAGDRNGKVIALNNALAVIDDYPLPVSASSLFTLRGKADDDLVFAFDETQLHQLATGARNVEGFPFATPEAAATVLLRSGTGTLGIGAVTPGGDVYYYSTKTLISGSDLLWSAIEADSRNSNQAPLPKKQAAEADIFFPEARCYNWPNPVYDGSTRIRFFVSDDADVSVKIYDLAGDKVDELRTHALGGVDNEIVWNVSNIESDVYLAKVEAIAPGKKGEKIIKIAVVR